MFETKSQRFPLRKKRLILFFVLCCCFLLMFALSGCESEEQPLPDQYVGYYRRTNVGCAYLGHQYVSCCILWVNGLEVTLADGTVTTVSNFIQVEPQFFTYDSDGNFSFDGEVNCYLDGFEGTAVLTGKLSGTLTIDQSTSTLIATDTECGDSIHDHD